MLKSRDKYLTAEYWHHAFMQRLVGGIMAEPVFEDYGPVDCGYRQ